jgi:imidazolonepropionase-like amidohydrolase
VFVDKGPLNGTLEAATTGIAAFAHLGSVPVTDETVAYMRAHQVTTLTTLAVFESGAGRRLQDLRFLDEPLLKDVMPPEFRRALVARAARPLTADDSARRKARLERLMTGMANLKKLHAAGVLIAAGTDAPYPGDYYGEGLHRELELLVEAGLTPLQAITVATQNAAQMLQAESEWGTVETGKRADLLVVRGDPSIRVGDTRNVTMVVLGGKLVDRAKLRFDPRTDPGFREGGSAR